MRAGAELEQDGRQVQALDRAPHGRALGGELLHGRTDEDPDALVRGLDRGRG
jgi:hypothetical protein